MGFFGVHQPGQRVVSQNGEMLVHLLMLKKHYIEANMALSLFQAVKVDSGDRIWFARSQEQAIKESLCGFNRAPSREEALEIWRKVRQVGLESGHEIERFLTAGPFLHARSFLYSLDNFQKHLEVIAKEPHAPENLKDASAAMADAFPNLVQVRNSAHHMEDRIRGLKTNEKPILVQGGEGVPAEPLGLLVVDSLRGTEYFCTMADGHLGSVDVTEKSLKSLQAILQYVLDSFEWGDDFWEVFP